MTEKSRGRGRPASFPGQKTVKLLTNLPASTREALSALAEKRGQNLNQVLDSAIRQLATKSKISVSDS